MSIDSYGIHIGILYFRFYGMLIMAGVVAATFLAQWMVRQEAKKRHISPGGKPATGREGWLSNPDIVWDGLLWVLIGGIIGARLYHIFTPSQSLLAEGIDTKYYLTHPIEMIMTWRGGLGMPGAIAGGVLGLYLFARRRKLSLGFPADVTAPGLAFAQAIGRWGNFINQELYGPPTDLPWGIYIRPENRLDGFQEYERFQPLFLYESMWNLANGLVLLYLWRKLGDRLKDGDLFLSYLAIYSLGRFLLEFLRIDYVPVAGINFNQALSLVIAIAAGVALYVRHRPRAQAAA